MKSLLRQAFFPPSQYHRISTGYHDNLLKKNIFYECLAFNSPLRECNRLGVGGVPITSTPWLCFGWTLTSEPKGRLFQEQLVLRAIPLAYYPPVLINTGKLVQTGLHVLQSGRREPCTPNFVGQQPPRTKQDHCAIEEFSFGATVATIHRKM